MGFFGGVDPAAASIEIETRLSGLVIEGDAVDAAVTDPQSRRKRSTIKRSVSLDGSSTMEESLKSPGISPVRRGGRRTKKQERVTIRRSKSGSSDSMQVHMEEIEDFCRVMQNAGSKERTKLLQKSMKYQQRRASKDGSS